MNKLQNTILYVLFAILWVLWLIIMLTPIAQEPTLVYTKDGCSTYRFYDKGSRNYYTDCKK